MAILMCLLCKDEEVRTASVRSRWTGTQIDGFGVLDESLNLISAQKSV